nr:hypothetical protein [Kibdelosporangium sp. MJ126-NF4]
MNGKLWVCPRRHIPAPRTAAPPVGLVSAHGGDGNSSTPHCA